MDLGSEKHVIQIWLSRQEDERQEGYIVEARRQEEAGSTANVDASRVRLDKDRDSYQDERHAAPSSALSRRVGGPSDHE